jgi:beta-glucuronidase
VPNAFNAGGTSLESMTGYPVWYRKDFTLPRTGAETSWIVRFESVNYSARVWLNGHRIGSHVGAYLPWELALSHLSRRGVNRLVIRVDNRRGSGDLPPGPGGGWWNYGGLLREVYVRPVERVDVTNVVVRPRLRCATCPATVLAEATVQNVTRRQQLVRVSGRYGSQRMSFPETALAAGSRRTVRAKIPIAHPRLWSPDSPVLYRATLTAAAAPPGRGMRTVARWSLHSGIRLIQVTPDGRLLLNGRRINFRGVALHEDDPALGSALTSAQRQRFVATARNVGATLIRSHYPLHPQFQELADRDGLLVWSEIPVYQVASPDLATARTRALADAFLKRNIETNQNHPSVLIWSVANELRFRPVHAEAVYYAHAAALVHKLDPTRPVGAATGGYPGIGCQPAYAPLQVIGLNDYFGWYSGELGSIADRDDLSPYLDELHACYPHKAVVVSEFGFEANRHGPREEKGTYEFQNDALDFHLRVFATKPWLAGAIYFALADFRCNPGWSGGNPRPDPPYHHKGLVDYGFHSKPAYAVAQAWYRATRQIAPKRR